jgi:hypothetical protein
MLHAALTRPLDVESKCTLEAEVLIEDEFEFITTSCQYKGE